MCTTACAPASRESGRLRGLLLVVLLLALGWGGAAGAEGLADQPADEPIEVVADELTVDQSRNLAVFRGHVQATQGSMVLRADELRVFYDLEAEGPQTVRRIEAEGHVVLSSPEETAKAESGAYDVAAGRIVLTGNVVLTRRDNVVRGRRLVVDLRRHTAAVEGDGERVRAVFRPEELRPQGGASPGRQQPKPGTDKAPANSRGGKQP